MYGQQQAHRSTTWQSGMSSWGFEAYSMGGHSLGGMSLLSQDTKNWSPAHPGSLMGLSFAVYNHPGTGAASYHGQGNPQCFHRALTPGTEAAGS